MLCTMGPITGRITDAVHCTTAGHLVLTGAHGPLNRFGTSVNCKAIPSTAIATRHRPFKHPILSKSMEHVLALPGECPKASVLW